MVRATRPLAVTVLVAALALVAALSDVRRHRPACAGDQLSGFHGASAATLTLHGAVFASEPEQFSDGDHPTGAET